MSYAQTNYSQKLGTGPDASTIHDAGCFLDSFCNLLDQWGIPVDPPTLNQFFIDHNDYVKEADGTADLLSWGSITAYNPYIRVIASGNGAPSSNNSIVKFVYDGGKTHFCLVVDHTNGTIIDSWDGKQKSWNTYGGPVQFATYTNATPAPATTAKAPVVTGQVNDKSYVIVKSIQGFNTSNGAANHIATDAHGVVAAGSYAIFNQAKGMINATATPGQPGAWINPADNVADPAPAPAPAGPEATDIHDVTETVTITDQLNVRSGPGTAWPGKEANTPDGTLHKGDIVQITGWGHGENAGGNDIWLRSIRGNWFWSGATTFDMSQTKTTEIPDTPAATPPAPVSAPTEAATPVSVSTPAVSTPVMTTSATPYDFKQSYEDGSGTYQLKQDVTVKDYAGIDPDLKFKKGDVLLRAGIFSVKNADGSETKMARTAQSVKNHAWYGFPQQYLNPVPTSMLTHEDLLSIGKQITSDVGKEVEKDLDDLFNDAEFKLIFDKETEDFAEGLRKIEKVANDKPLRDRIISGIVKVENVFTRKK